jgi:hypothetical protein
MKPAAHNAVATRLLDRAQAADYAGYDPFDGLNSRLFQATPLRKWPLARLAWLQAFKRLPVNLRAVTGVPRLRNPKGIGLFVLGLIEQWRTTGDALILAEAQRLGDWLLDAHVDRAAWGHSAWGYHFDWEARAFYVPRGTPNAITTCYVSGALRELTAASGDPRYAQAANDAALFLDRTLSREDADGLYYGYVPGDPTFVHNASLWVAARVAEAAAATDNAALAENALRATRRSVAMQEIDGSWWYGTRPHHRFIDGFHTGYNLEALARLQAALSTNEFQASIERGYDYYKRHFFEPDGAVRYYAGKRWPEETHSSCQAIITLIRVGGTRDYALARAVARYMIDQFYDARRECFIYRRTRLLRNGVDYTRWSQAWAFYALAMMARVEAGAHLTDLEAG